MNRFGLGRRVAVLALLFATELAIVSLYFDGANLARDAGALGEFLRKWGATALRFATALAALLTTFAYLSRRAELESLASRVREAPVRWWLLAIQLAAFGLFVAAGRALYAGAAHEPGHVLYAVTFLITGISLVILGALALLQFAMWLELIRTLGTLWAYSSAAAVLITFATTATRALWQPASQVTFHLVQIILRPFVPQLTVEPDRFRILTGRYGVIIAPECSGLEGIGLLLLFGAFWLWVFRKECRFPHALALLPAGIVLLFLLNSARIAALVLIGHAGAREVASQGFHSQAGWITFNAVAFGFCVAARRVRWVSIGGGQQLAATHGANPVAAYLTPFLAILAAGMVSRAVTGNFEWLYTLRLFAAAAAFWAYRRDYKTLDWRAGWIGPVAGALVFLLWVGLEHALRPAAAVAAMPAALQSADAGVRILWIAARVVSAVVAAPIAEELAFRGFLIRRFLSTDFDSHSMRIFNWFGLIGSSVLFGALHGERWIAGSLAGLIYGFVLVRRGRLGDAVLAHATTNALLAGEVLVFGAWQYW